MLQDWATHIDSSTFEKFVHQWMQLSVRDRKTLSHNGAVRSRPGDPCHYHCPVEQVTYFDPSNKIYSVALSTLAPQLDFENWNMETRGDICESLMGYAYLVKMRGVKGRDENVEKKRKAWQTSSTASAGGRIGLRPPRGTTSSTGFGGPKTTLHAGNSRRQVRKSKRPRTKAS